MNITSIVLFGTTAAILILALAFVFVVFYLSRITKTLHDNLSMKDGVFRKSADLLDEARTKAMKVIDDANSRAIDIVNKAALAADVSSENFNEEVTRVSSTQIKRFEKATSDFAGIYSQIFQDLKTKNIEIFQKISKDIETDTMSEIKNFRDSMQKLTVSSQEEVRKKIYADYETANREIENYKKEELLKIDSEIYKFLEKMSKLVIGKAFSLSEHEELIEESLEKAKNEGVFRT